MLGKIVEWVCLSWGFGIEKKSRVIMDGCCVYWMKVWVGGCCI